MFDILEADIVVVQELKIQRKDLRDDMVLIPGWDVYLSVPKYQKGEKSSRKVDLKALTDIWQDTPVLQFTLEIQYALQFELKKESLAFLHLQTPTPVSVTSQKTSKLVDTLPPLSSPTFPLMPQRSIPKDAV